MEKKSWIGEHQELMESKSILSKNSNGHKKY